MNSVLKNVLLFVFVIIAGHPVNARILTPQEQKLYNQAHENGLLAREGFRRCRDYLNGWLKYTDTKGPVSTLLIPQAINNNNWQPHNSAADNYAFMVLVSAFVDQSKFKGVMQEMLDNEKKYASVNFMPVNYDLEFDQITGKPDVFLASEYVKDGLMAITEWLGDSPWYDRMIEIQNEMWTNHKGCISTDGQPMISTDVEVNGEQLQMLPRLYWTTGQSKYLDWAKCLGDHYLLGKDHPTDDFTSLRLRDHGNEIIGGLSELYATLHFVEPEKAAEYKPHLYRMLDRILEVGTNQHGLFYNVINPQTGTIVNKGLADTFGYVLNAYYTVYLIDGVDRYKQAIITALSNLKPYYTNNSFGENMDGRADAVEGTLNLYNRLPIPSAAEWIDDSIRDMWALQKESGIIEGWHGDGNFARTTIMYCLWKTQGITITPWRDDVVLGTVRKENKVYIYINSQKDWKGKLLFDTPRHRDFMNMPLDWPRINQFPEWFTLKDNYRYVINDITNTSVWTYSASELQEGLTLDLKAQQDRHFELTFIK